MEIVSYADLMEFTNGKWDTIPFDKRYEVEQACRLKLQEMARRKAWENICPPAYRNTVPQQLPNVAKFEQVQKWRYGPTGLLLVGPTRRGKTRSVWNLLKRLHLDERRSMIAFNPMDLKLGVAMAWRDPEEAEFWVDRLRTVHVLFFDDLDAVKFTEAVEETIYDAFESRPMHRKPVIATSTGPVASWLPE